MTFLWPEFLWLLLLLPAVCAAYVVLLRRRKKTALRYASLHLVREAAFAGGQWRRHVPPLLFLVALALLLVAVARPTAVLTLPSQHETVILAMDVSGSMRATDVKPSRLGAAQEAARAFVAERPRSTRLGVVSFAATASVVQSPTHNREDLLAAVDRFQLQRGTAVGSGILVSLKMIFPDVEFDLRSANPRPKPPRGTALDASGASSASGAPGDKGAARAPAGQPVKPAPPGSYTSAAIILLTDGQATTGPDPIESARMAADRGVRVYTVGIGTPTGEIVGAEGWSMRVRLDEEALKNIANITRAEYFFAGSAPDLRKIYEKLNTRIFFEEKEMEVTALVAAAAALAAFASALLSLWWFNRIL
jgi:Ca-activated chloride channel family protein